MTDEVKSSPPATEPTEPRFSIVSDPAEEQNAFLEALIELGTPRVAWNPLPKDSPFENAGNPGRRLGMIVNPLVHPTNEGEVKPADTVALPALANEFNGALTETIQAYQTKLNERPSPVIIINPPRDMNDHHSES